MTEGFGHRRCLAPRHDASHAIRVPRVRMFRPAMPPASFRSHLTLGTLAVRLGVPVIKASGLAPSRHFPVGVRLPVDSARGAARHAWRTSGRPGSADPGPPQIGRAGSDPAPRQTASLRAVAYPRVQEARRWPPPSLRLVWPVRLSVVVTWRRGPPSVCWPSFPPPVPPAGAPFPPRGLVGSMPPRRRCRVGGGAHRRARLRPPLKRYVRFSRIPLSQGCPGAERWKVLTSGPSALLWD